MTFDEKKATFLTSKMQSYLREMISKAFEEGWLQITFLEIDNCPIAGYLNFDYDDRLWIYNSGINPEYFSFSPGWVLLGNIIQWAIKNDRKGIDFLRGDEAYKYRFGAEDRFIHRLILSR
jgi:CelD/BcsL family acetyltransferase involved in cellulose biosynthesis